MNSLRKSIACLMVLGLMPSPKAAAENWSYGIKIAGTTSFGTLSDQEKKASKLLQSNGPELAALKQVPILGEAVSFGQGVAEAVGGLNYSMWNPWFGVALYMERSFNDHIGLGAELLYNRFDKTIKSAGISSSNKICSVHTIAKNALLTWYWTRAIRPDFKDDYFLGRLFAGLHICYCIKRTQKDAFTSNLTELGSDTDGSSTGSPSSKNEKRLKFGFVGGTSWELPNGLLLELKSMLPYNLLNIKNKDERPLFTSVHVSVGFNLAKLY
ncbi:MULTISPECIES: PorT family protein [unclassified Candidatus Cardinium]|uniref:PorT family protein n=1 Tax=unclassified Candidatus Cardinium TaxID=2641185 RepID=UPI001FB2EF9C|nr:MULTISPECIES: PorT family protein [unclassified Candidatus Cardinium]